MMNAEQLQSVRELVEANDEQWPRDEADDYTCPSCGSVLFLAPELEPRGLCDRCMDKLIEQLPALVDLAALGLNVDVMIEEHARMTAEITRLRGLNDAWAESASNELAEADRLRAWLKWARARLLDGGRGETSLLGIANVLAGIEDALTASEPPA